MKPLKDNPHFTVLLKFIESQIGKKLTPTQVMTTHDLTVPLVNEAFSEGRDTQPIDNELNYINLCVSVVQIWVATKVPPLISAQRVLELSGLSVEQQGDILLRCHWHLFINRGSYAFSIIKPLKDNPLFKGV